MKPLEIVSMLSERGLAARDGAMGTSRPTNADATSASLPGTPDEIVDSPAFAAPFRLGEEQATLRPASVEPAASETLSLSVAFGDEPHTLRIAKSPRFPDLCKIWDSRADVPEAILLALVERECGAFFQLLENAVRKQLRLVGISHSGADAQEESNSDSSDTGANAPGVEESRALASESEKSEFHLLCASTLNQDDEGDKPIVFALTRTPTIVAALGVLRNLDLDHEAVRGVRLDAEAEYAAFQMPDADLASLAPGDALALPEIGSVPPRLIAAGMFVVDESGVAPFKEDAMCRVRGAERRTVTLGELFDAASGGSQGAANVANVEMLPIANANVANWELEIGTGNSGNNGNIIQLRLVKSGKTIATGRLGKLADTPAFIVESTPTPYPQKLPSLKSQL